MIFLSGITFPCSDQLSFSPVPTNVEEITEITLQNGLYDEFVATTNMSTDKTETFPDWGFDTVLHAFFNEDASAGNVDWKLATTSGVLIKRKLSSDYNWTSIYYKDITSLEDLDFSGRDYTATNGTYEYAIVPLLGTNEGTYSKTDIDVTLDKLVVIDSDQYFTTVVTDGSCAASYVNPSTPIEPLYNKFPTIVSKADTCYQTIEVTASFYSDLCDVDTGIFDDKTRIDYMNKVCAFLNNKKPKILKNVDGQMWLVYVTTPPSTSIGDVYKFKTLSFGCTEVGDINDEEILYMSGFINVPEKYWNN